MDMILLVLYCKPETLKFSLLYNEKSKITKKDNEPAFISILWAEFGEKYNFIHKKITRLHPAAYSGS